MGSTRPVQDLQGRTGIDDAEATRTDGDSARAPDGDDALGRGRSIGRYLIVEVLGAGAMGVVYRAYDPDLDRGIALKVVASSERGSTHGAREQARLLREAQAMARVRHPNVIGVFDVGALEGGVYVAMELVDGLTLKAWMADERRPSEVLRVFEAAGRGLAAAHARGLTHRDFKPDNVMIDREGQPRVLDFGLARASHRPEIDASTESLRSGEHAVSLETSMTEAGSLLGTPAYMSPEQYHGSEVDHRSDQFAFCVALFEALIGRRPFPGNTVTALAASVTQGNIDVPSRVDVSRGVMKAIVRGLSVDPRDRHASMDALLAALRRSRTNPRSLGILVGAAGVSLAAVAWASSVSPPARAPAPCQGARDAADAVLTPQRRAAIAAVFESEAGALGVRTWQDATDRVDAYLDAWARERTEACEATRIRGDQSEMLLDRRIACYDARLSSVDATLSALERADAIAVVHAHDAVDGFDPLQACAQAERLLDASPRPTDAQTLQRLTDLERRHDVIDANLELGHYEQALEPARVLATDADALGYAPMRARASMLLGDAEVEAGRGLDGAAALEDALSAAIEAGDDHAAAEAALELAGVAGHVISEPDRGLRALELGRAFARRSPLRGTLEIVATGHEASIAVTQGEMARALELHEEVRDYWSAREDGQRQVALALLDIGSVLTALGRAEDAVAVLEEGVEIRTLEYGGDHPATANALRELGSALSKLERFEQAQEALSRALRIQQDARGPSREVAVLLDDLGRVLRAGGDLDGATQRHQRAYAIWETLYDGPNPSLVVSRLNIGYTLSAAGKFGEAFEAFDQALKMSVEASGPEHPHVVYAANAAASALVDQERYDEAYVYAKQALDLDGRAEVPPTLLAETRFIAAHALWKDGNVPAATKVRARALARRAREIYAQGPAQWAPSIEKIDAWLGDDPELETWTPLSGRRRPLCCGRSCARTPRSRRGRSRSPPRP